MGLIVKEFLNIAEGILRDAGDADFKTDAEILLCHEIGYDANRLFMNWTRELADMHTEKAFELIRRRADGTPTQYLTRKQAFMDCNFYVDERVLIPRADTETLVDEVSLYLKTVSAKTLLDVGTGSGVIAVSLARKYPALQITATDVSNDALAVARKNASSLHADKRMKFVKSDLFAMLKPNRKFDVIVSNPPYIKSDVLPTLQREIYEHEPLLALDGGADGLDFYRRIIDDAPAYLKKTGALFLEIGNDQAAAVSALFAEKSEFEEAVTVRDVSGNDRVVWAVVNK